MKHENPTINYQQKKELVKLGKALHSLTSHQEQAEVLACRILEACNFNTGAELIEEACDVRFHADDEISKGLQVLVEETNTRYQYHCGCMTELALQVLARTSISYDKYSAIAEAFVCRQNNSHSFSHLTMCGFGRILAYKEVNHESRTEPLPI